MIRGVVTADYDAIIRLVVIGSRGQRERIEAVVDTGFDGWLSLPLSMIRDLELPWFRRGRASLGDGSESLFNIYRGSLVWDGKRRKVVIDACDTTPLVGMRMLAGWELNLPVQQKSRFVIRKLQKSL